jgi:hypothetical protein
MQEIGIDISRRKRNRLSAEMQLHADWAIAIRLDATAHRLRLMKLFPALIEEFGERRPAEVIRGCAYRILEDYDDVPIRTHILTLAHKQTRDCLRQERCDLLELGAR